MNHTLVRIHRGDTIGLGGMEASQTQYFKPAPALQ